MIARTQLSWNLKRNERKLVETHISSVSTLSPTFKHKNFLSKAVVSYLDSNVTSIFERNLGTSQRLQKSHKFLPSPFLQKNFAVCNFFWPLDFRISFFLPAVFWCFAFVHEFRSSSLTHLAQRFAEDKNDYPCALFYLWKGKVGLSQLQCALLFASCKFLCFVIWKMIRCFLFLLGCYIAADCGK